MRENRRKEKMEIGNKKLTTPNKYNYDQVKYKTELNHKNRKKMCIKYSILQLYI